MLRAAAAAAALASALLLALPAAAYGQQRPAADSTVSAGTAAVRAVIDRLFDAVRAGDSAAVRATFAPPMRLMTVAAQKKGGDAKYAKRPRTASCKRWACRTTRRGTSASGT